ncbi:MAG: hypothetical protein AAB381_01240 [Patescibacteria group bacterium]
MKKNHHLFLLFLAISVVTLVIGVYAYMHYVVTVSIQRAATARDIVALERANSGREEDVKALHARTLDDRKALAKFLIPADRVVEFIEALEALGPQSGSVVSLSGLSDVAPGEIEGSIYGLARASVQVTGTWTGVMRALSLTENLPYAVTIRDARLDSSAEPAKGRSWRATFTVEVLLSKASSSPARNP